MTLVNGASELSNPRALVQTGGVVISILLLLVLFAVERRG